MLIEAARRVEAAAKDVLAGVGAGSASCAEMREMLRVTKAAMAVISTAQTDAAAAIAARERHGDGGVQVLADAAGLSRHDARGQVKATKAVEAAPAVREALEEGRVSLSNAKRLAEAVDKTSAADVDGDAELLAKAESMRPEDFKREVRRWAAARQADSGESDHRRLRARRRVRVWNGGDGMVHLHGEFDPATGRRIGNRLQAEARRLYDNDKNCARAVRDADDDTLGDDAGGCGRGDAGLRRTFDQCMADALDNLTDLTSASGGTKPLADITVVAHVDNDTGQLIAEIAGGDPLPASVLEELACNARLRGAVFDTNGTLLWQGHTKRVATEAQMNALIARYGGCFHCLAHPDMCQGHHIKPVSQGGPTNIDNMVLICWDCHQRIHHHGWQIRTHRGRHTLHPPQRTHYGPAHAPEQPILHTSHAGHAADAPTRPAPEFQPPPRRHPAPRDAEARRDADGARASRAGPATHHSIGDQDAAPRVPSLFDSGQAAPPNGTPVPSRTAPTLPRP